MPFWAQPLAVVAGIIGGAFVLVWFADNFPCAAVGAAAASVVILIWMLSR